jgi:hypothetical protein
VTWAQVCRTEVGGVVKGAISVPVRASVHQKEPSATCDCNKLRVPVCCHAIGREFESYGYLYSELSSSFVTPYGPPTFNAIEGEK